MLSKLSEEDDRPGSSHSDSQELSRSAKGLIRESMCGNVLVSNIFSAQ